MIGLICVRGSSAKPQAASGFDEAVAELLEYRPLDEDARRGGALLVRVAECGTSDPRDGLVEVGVGEDDDRVLAAQLRHQRLHVARAGADVGDRLVHPAPDRT